MGDEEDSFDSVDEPNLSLTLPGDQTSIIQVEEPVDKPAQVQEQAPIAQDIRRVVINRGVPEKISHSQKSIIITQLTLVVTVVRVIKSICQVVNI